MRSSRSDSPGSPESPPARAGCRNAAMALLASREYGRRELSSKLRARGFAQDVVDEVLDALADERLLDERRMAESFVSSRVGRGQGPVRIRLELNERGVAAAAIETALAEAGVDWQALAGEVRRRRFGEQPSSDFKERSRQYRFLASRGFTPEQIRSALDDGGND